MPSRFDPHLHRNSRQHTDPFQHHGQSRRGHREVDRPEQPAPFASVTDNAAVFFQTASIATTPTPAGVVDGACPWQHERHSAPRHPARM
jgi:hypothetical protein